VPPATSTVQKLHEVDVASHKDLLCNEIQVKDRICAETGHSGK
jgi:hypothetical protein